MGRWRAAMSLLALAFAGRVFGQAVVAFGLFERVGLTTPSAWPPMLAWYSGLVPYPLLLPIQLIILGFQAWHLAQWGPGRLDVDRQGAQRRSRWLIGVGVIYSLTMVTRYAIAIHAQNDDGAPWWDGGLIPVLFHQVLAGYLITWGWALRQRAKDAHEPIVLEP